MVVLSLFDGISGARMALDRAGIKVDKYFASEIKDIAIKCAKDNYPDTVEIGDVCKVSFSDGVLHTENGDFKTKIDLIAMGSPCQSFSIAIPDPMRIGLGDKARSGLFYEGYRIMKEVNPKFFLLENVRSMKACDRDVLTGYMGVEPIVMDGADFGPAIRKRYYWTNIPLPAFDFVVKKDGYTEVAPSGVIAPSLNGILESGWSDRDKARCLAVIDSRPNSTPVKMFHRYYSTGFTTLIFKDKKHYEACEAEYLRQCGGKRKCTDTATLVNSDIFNGVRYMTQKEMEICQAVPLGYTKSLTRNEAADVLGDGWQIDVIAHIFEGLK